MRRGSRACVIVRRMRDGLSAAGTSAFLGAPAAGLGGPGLRLRGQGSGGLRALSCKVQVEKDVDAVGAALCSYVQGLGTCVHTSRLLALHCSLSLVCSPSLSRVRALARACATSRMTHSLLRASQTLPKRQSTTAAASPWRFPVCMRERLRLMSC